MPQLTPLESLEEQPTDAAVTIRATLAGLQLKRNKLGELWATMRLTQDETLVTVLVFARAFAAIPAGTLTPEVMLTFDARVLRNSDGTVRLTPVTTPELAR